MRRVIVSVWRGMPGWAQPHTRDAVAEQRKQVGVALRLHREVALVRGGRQREGHPVRVQVPQQPLRACTIQQNPLPACARQYEQCEQCKCLTWVSAFCRCVKSACEAMMGRGAAPTY